MKKLLMILFLGLAVAFQVNAQDKQNKDKMKIDDKDVPQAVRTAFDNQFDNALLVNWKKKDNNYKASFRMANGKKHMAEFSSSGELISKAEKIDNDELPSPVTNAVSSNYSSNKIDEAYRVEKSGQTLYMVKLDGDPVKKVIYDSQGQVVDEKTK